VPEKYLKLYGSNADEPNDRIRYFATISAMDDALGRVLRTLDELSLRENTLVIFFNDNGANTSREHGLKFATNAPYRGGRPDCWEGGIRVPAIFRWPGQLPADVDCDTPLIATDVLPMILATAGVSPPAGRVLDGIDPTAILAGRAPAPERVLGWEYGGQAAVRSGRHKLMRPGRNQPFQLFDLVADPGERRDLAARETATAARLSRAYQDWLDDVKRDASEPPPEVPRAPRKKG
jgi:arylsulfatase A-like enzyme